MKKSLLLTIIVFLIILLTGCANGEDNGSTSDPIIGKWKMTSESNDGIPTALTACDLMNTFEFTSGGKNINTAYYADNGDCVAAADSDIVIKWVNVVKDNYRIKAYQKGVKLYDLDIQTSFSAGNNKLLTTSTDVDGVIRVTTLEKINNE